MQPPAVTGGGIPIELVFTRVALPAAYTPPPVIEAELYSIALSVMVTVQVAPSWYTPPP